MKRPNSWKGAWWNIRSMLADWLLEKAVAVAPPDEQASLIVASVQHYQRTAPELYQRIFGNKAKGK